MKTVEEVEEIVCEAAARLKPRVKEAKRQVSSWNDSLSAYIKENPGRCLVGALALGFVVGKIARRV